MKSVDDKDVGALLVTGDFTFLASPDEFAHARQALNTMMGRFDLSTDHVVIVPGNHDIAWTRPKDERYERDSPVDVAPKVAREAYENFYRDVLRHDPRPDLAMGRRLLFDTGVVLDIVALNSSALETGNNYLAGMGHLGAGTFEDVRREMGWESQGGEAYRSLALRVLALHHHLLGAEDVEDPAEYYSGFGTAVDARGILRAAARCGASLALHGHRHRPFVWRSEVYALPERDRTLECLGSVSIVGAGSAGSLETEGQRNFFNTLEPRPDQLVLTTYCANKGDATFRAMKPPYVAPLRCEGGGLTVGSWGGRANS